MYRLILYLKLTTQRQNPKIEKEWSTSMLLLNVSEYCSRIRSAFGNNFIFKQSEHLSCIIGDSTLFKGIKITLQTNMISVHRQLNRLASYFKVKLATAEIMHSFTYSDAFNNRFCLHSSISGWESIVLNSTYYRYLWEEKEQYLFKGGSFGRVVKGEYS